MQEKFEDSKGVVRNYRTDNTATKRKRRKRASNNLQNTTQITKYWAQRNPLISGGLILLNLFPRPGLYSSLLCGWPIKTYMEKLRNRESLLTRKLLIQGFLVVFRLKQVLRRCYIRRHVFVNQYQISVSHKW
jgi:hypothetical protein